MSFDTAEVRYARSGDLHIGYRVFGEGAFDIVRVAGFTSNLASEFWATWETEELEALGGMARCLIFDKRGTGISDRVPGAPSLEERWTTFGRSWTPPGPRAALHRDARLPVGTDAGGVGPENGGRGPHLGDAPACVRDRAARRPPAGRRDPHGSGPPHAAGCEPRRCPGVARDERRDRREVGPPQRAGADAGAELSRQCRARPVRRRPDPGCRTRRVGPGRGQRGPGLASAFLARAHEDWERRTSQPERVLATVLFTDLVDSTQKAAELGPRWSELLREHNLRIRRELARYRGREIDTAGDGFFASGFDGPARAIRCACAIRDSIQELGLDIRVGVHTGECDVVDGKLAGLAVVIGSRIAVRRTTATSSSRAPSATSSPDRGSSSRRAARAFSRGSATGPFSR